MTQSWSETIATASQGSIEINPYRRLKKCRPGQFQTERHTPRDVGQVDSRLLQVFGRLATGRARWPLYLFGEPGRGKTLATLAFCDRVHFGRYFTPNALMTLCTQEKRRLPWAQEGAWAEPGIELAVLDEVGAGAINDFHFQMVKEFADDRELRHHRVAIYVSNLPPDAIRTKYDDRIASRMLCGTIYELTGLDRRVQEAES